MHIPDAMLNGAICPVTAAISVTGLTLAAVMATRAEKRPTAAWFAAITALIFAGQMMNFPIMNGTSGHLLGGVLAAGVLGTPFGVLAVALVVTLQALVFADGGLTVLGANILNMALLGAGMGGLLHAALQRRGMRDSLAIALAAWCSVMVAATAVSVQLAIDGKIALSSVLPAMLGTHALIGVGEALITVVACAILAGSGQTAKQRTSLAVPLAAAGIIALMLSPFASSFPDGLEWVAEQYAFFHQSAPLFVAPLPDYAFPSVDNPALSTGLAGLLGVGLCFVSAWMIGRLLEYSATSRAT